MKHLALTIIFFTLANTSHAGLFDAIANFYDSRDRCQLKNYPGGVKHADVSELPSYCGKSNYSRTVDAERKGYVPIANSIYFRGVEVDKVSPIKGGGYLITHKNGNFEYVPKP